MGFDINHAVGSSVSDLQNLLQKIFKLASDVSWKEEGEGTKVFNERKDGRLQNEHSIYIIQSLGLNLRTIRRLATTEMKKTQRVFFCKEFH